MSIACISCTCGSVDRLIRSRLDQFGYRDALTIPIVRGKDKSKSFLNTLPQQHDALDMLREHLRTASKYAVVIGYNEDAMRWVDLANGKAIVNNVDLEKILEYFA